MLGRFGPPLKVERTEKHWTDNEDWKYFFKDINYCSRELIADHWFYYWLTDFKFYGAEWIED